MIEEIIRNYLLDNVSVPVYIDVPAAPGDSYVKIERTGGGEEEHIRRATVAVQSYGASMLAAATLHESLLDILPDIVERDDVSACDLNAEYNFTDTTTKQYRYQSVWDIVYY